ncbi:linear amide C-N hydrolase [Bacillus thuringiensis]|nr:linear amide C-N hydrolase [Bacillus thuringiensis]
MAFTKFKTIYGLKSQPCEGDIPLSAFGQGSGSMGLNGDFTLLSRFIRAAYGK